VHLQTLRRVVLVAAVAAAGAVALLEQPVAAQSIATALFDRYLESLRQQAGIPGLSVVIVQDREIAWDRGYGYRDVESSLPARGDTPYPIGDLTQTFAAVLLMQCVERGTLRLEDGVPPSALSSGDATVRQLLAHVPSATVTAFKYDATGFARLTPVVDACGGESARLRVARQVFEQNAMVDSVPGRDLEDPTSAARPSFDAAQLERYASVLARLAVPYKVDRRGRATRSELPPKRLDATTGLVSSARDLANYDAALERLLHDDARNVMWSNATAAGTTRPTGLGWFVQTYNGERIIWHFSNMTDAYSGLILKVPSRKLTLILLANSDGLSYGFDLAQGDVTKSLFALTFLRLFL
jgi:CubicO group peptidase (beta-lactamase class C family)